MVTRLSRPLCPCSGLSSGSIFVVVGASPSLMQKRDTQKGDRIIDLCMDRKYLPTALVSNAPFQKRGEKIRKGERERAADKLYYSTT